MCRKASAGRRRLITPRALKSVKFILPALTEATSPYWRPIKYSLFPPLGLATLAAYLDPDIDISLQDEHVEKLDLDNEPDLVIIQVYITNAYRAYEIADHYRARGSLCRTRWASRHFPSRMRRQPHADTIFLGPGEHTFPQFLRDLAAGTPQRRYESSVRTLERIATYPSGSYSATSIPGPKLNRSLARLSASLHLLLQGWFL